MYVLKNFFVALWRAMWVRVVCIVLIIFGILVAVIYATGWYPIVSVEGSPIFAYQYRMSLRLAHNFYNSLEQSAHVTAPKDEELEKVVFDGLIDDVLITRQLLTSFSQDELQQKINTRIDAMINTSDSKQQALSLSQLSETDTRIYFLDPLARQQILSELFSLQKEDIGSWLLYTRSNAHISMWIMGGEWLGEKGYQK
jgi:hypothetical protein